MFFEYIRLPGKNVNISGCQNRQLFFHRLANGQVHVRCRVLLEVEVAIAPVHPGGEKRKFASNHQKVVVFWENEKRFGFQKQTRISDISIRRGSEVVCHP